MSIPSGDVSKKLPDRDQLILDTLPLVRHVVKLVATKLPNHIDRNDMVSAGIIGLVDAADKFDPAFNVKFSTYAYERILGEILSYLRSLKTPCESLDEILSRQSHLSFPVWRLKMEFEQPDSSQPEQNAIDAQIRERLASAIDSLNQRQRLVIVLSYYEEMDQEAIAEIMGTTYESVRSILSRARKNLRNFLSQKPIN